MATASLSTMHTACVRLRDSLDRWLSAFEGLAYEAAAASATERAVDARKVLRSEASVRILALAGTDQGIAAAELAQAVQMSNDAAGARLAILASRGHLVRVSLPGRRVRYFAKAEHAAAWDAGGPPPLEVADAREALEVGMPRTAAAEHHEPVRSLAAMLEADAPAVAAALAVIAPEACAPPAQPKPARPQRKLTGWQENSKLITVVQPKAPVKATGEAIVPENVKRTVVNAPAFDARFQVDPKTVSADPESFSAQWARLRGKPGEACDS
jgi:hypothetical protein